MSAAPSPSPYERLLSPFAIRHLSLRNRAVVLPMGASTTADGAPTERDVAFYRERTRTGAALVVTGGTAVSPSGTMADRRLYEAFSEHALPGLGTLADGVHADGASIVGQLFHMGRELSADASQWPVVAPSAVAPPSSPQVPHALSVAEILRLVEAFAACAAALVSAGYDGVEIHAAHGYLVAEFLSPFANHRVDAYGGSAEHRMRFLREILDAVRERCGTHPVLGVRLSVVEGVEGGLELDDSIAIATELADRGDVDYLSLTIGIRGAYVRDMATPEAAAAPLAGAVRRACGLPVLAAQRIARPEVAEDVLARGDADLVGMARAFIADARWVEKARRGESHRIRPCIACVQECRTRVGGIGCSHNPVAGRELDWGGDLPRAARPRRVVVAGGGPAGLEAAVVAAARGHDVVLLERAVTLGGQARLAAAAPGRGAFLGVVTPRVADLERHGVDVRLGTEATTQAVLAERPDVAVVATGAQPAASALGDGVLTVWDLLGDAPADLGGARRAVVLDDGAGFWETCSAVEALAARGLRVVVVTPARSAAAGIPAESVTPLLARFVAAAVELRTRARATAVVGGAVLVRYVLSNVEERIDADVVVASLGKRADDALARALEAELPEVHAVGDCVSPRRVTHAVREAHRVARAL